MSETESINEIVLGAVSAKGLPPEKKSPVKFISKKVAYKAAKEDMEGVLLAFDDFVAVTNELTIKSKKGDLLYAAGRDYADKEQFGLKVKIGGVGQTLHMNAENMGELKSSLQEITELGKFLKETYSDQEVADKMIGLLNANLSKMLPKQTDLKQIAKSK